MGAVVQYNFFYVGIYVAGVRQIYEQLRSTGHGLQGGFDAPLVEEGNVASEAKKHSIVFPNLGVGGVEGVVCNKKYGHHQAHRNSHQEVG